MQYYFITLWNIKSTAESASSMNADLEKISVARNVVYFLFPNFEEFIHFLYQGFALQI